MAEKIRVLEFSDFVNRHDFVDTILQRADPQRFLVGLCVRTTTSNISAPTYSEEMPYWVLPGLHRSALPASVWQLAGILRRWKADILHTHHFDQAMIGWLATRINRSTRLVIGRHYSDSLYRLPQQGISISKKWALLRIEQATNHAAKRIIVPSSFIRKLLMERQRIAGDKIDVIHYGFAPDKFETIDKQSVQQVREEFKLRGRFVIGTFARLDGEKGHRFLVDALRKVRERVPNILWLIVGEGSERSAIERQIENAGLTDRVVLTGWRRDAMSVMAAIDAVVQPTLQEAFSQVMVEALWMQKALIMTDVGGASDIIRHEENGMLVPPSDSEALANTIIRIAEDPILRAKLGETGKAEVQQKLRIDKMIGAYETAFVRAME